MNDPQPPNFSPELQLLLRSCRLEPDPGFPSSCEHNYFDVICWDRWQFLARQHGVCGLMLNHFARLPEGDIPELVIEALEQHQHRVSKNNLYMTGELIRLLELLTESKIPSVTFKGPAIAEKVYGDLSLREYSDLDIVVPRSRVREAVNVLHQNGYGIGYGLSREQIPPAMHAVNHLPLHHKGHHVMVELHWELFDNDFVLNYPLDGWWSDFSCRTSDLGWPPIPDEEMLLLLCAHGTKHRWEMLKWLVDVAELIKGSDRIDWSRLDRLMESHHCTRVVGLGLLLAHDWLQAPVPSQVVSKMDADTRLKQLAREVVLSWECAGSSPQSQLQRLKFHLATRERFVDKVMVALGPVRTSKPADWRIVSLPRSLFPLYYGIRLCRLVWRWLVKPLWRFVVGDKGVRNRDHDG